MGWSGAVTTAQSTTSELTEDTLAFDEELEDACRPQIFPTKRDSIFNIVNGAYPTTLSGQLGRTVEARKRQQNQAGRIIGRDTPPSPLTPVPR